MSHVRLEPRSTVWFIPGMPAADLEMMRTALIDSRGFIERLCTANRETPPDPGRPVALVSLYSPLVDWRTEVRRVANLIGFGLGDGTLRGPAPHVEEGRDMPKGGIR